MGRNSSVELVFKMSECSGRPTGSAINVIVFSLAFMPTALVSSLSVIFVILRHKSGVRTEMNMFILTSSLAGLPSIFVNGMRVWHHYSTAVGIHVQSAYPFMVPALSACHVFWISSQSIAAMCFLAMLLMYIFDRQSLTRGFSWTRSSLFYKCTIALILSLGFGIGFCSMATNLRNMMRIKSVLFCILAVGSCILACFLSYVGRDAPNSPKSSVVSLRESKNVAVIVESPAERSDGIEILANYERNFQDQEINVEQYGGVILYKTLFYSSFALLEGLLLLTRGFLAPWSCKASFWLQDVSSLFMQCYLAISPVFFIAVCPRLKQAFLSMFRRPEVLPALN